MRDPSSFEDPGVPLHSNEARDVVSKERKKGRQLTAGRGLAIRRSACINLRKKKGKRKKERK